MAQLYKQSRIRRINWQQFLPLGIGIIAFLFALIYNELNIYELAKNKQPLREYKSVITADDISYIAPAINFVQSGVLKNNDAGIQCYYERPPGYSLFIATCMFFGGINNWIEILTLIQILLFACSAAFFYKSLMLLYLNKNVVFIVTVAYSLTPFCSGFLYYTITEAITPALMVFFSYFIIRAYSIKKQLTTHLIVAAIIYAVLMSVRPVLGIIGVVFPFVIFHHYNFRRASIKIYFSISIIALSTTVLWAVRNYNISNRVVGLHPIYENSNNSEFRPTHQAMWQLAKQWGEEGATFHSYMVPFWNESIHATPSRETICAIVNHMPNWALESIGRENMVVLLEEYQQSILFQKQFYNKQLPMPDSVPNIELQVINRLTTFKTKLNKEYPVECFVKTPAKVFARMAFHSNLSMFLFQKTYRGIWLIELSRILFFVLHSLAFICIPIVFILSNNRTIVKYISTSIALYLMYLMFIQIGIEERYTAPVLPILLIILSVIASEIINYYRHIRIQNTKK